MSEALTKFSIERNADEQKITIRHGVGKELLLYILLAGLCWLITIWKWNSKQFNFFLIISLLYSLYWVYFFLSSAFEKTTIDVEGNDIIITGGRFPFSNKKVLNIEDISCVYFVFGGTWLGARKYDLFFTLDSGEKVCIAEKLVISDDTEATAITKEIFNSVKRIEPPMIER